MYHLLVIYCHFYLLNSLHNLLIGVAHLSKLVCGVYSDILIGMELHAGYLIGSSNDANVVSPQNAQ